MRADNSYLQETIIIANKIKDNPSADVSEEKTKIDEMSKEAISSANASHKARP